MNCSVKNVKVIVRNVVMTQCICNGAVIVLDLNFREVVILIVFSDIRRTYWFSDFKYVSLLYDQIVY